ncbi:MAG: phosphoglycerate kinase [Flavobacteriaceae bacterium]|nr:MAG: phosphoglycerate kinase [Flavobacteriaceae bacterium]
MQNIQSYNFKDKKAIVRVDFNVPLDDTFNIEDPTRITSALPTINHILNSGGSVILLSHLGRPEGEKNMDFSFSHLLSQMEKLIGKPILFSSDCIGEEADQKKQALKPGEILMMENVRFYTQETKGDMDFAKELSKHADVYVNDAFGAAHRSHASTTQMANFFDDKLFGFLMEKELLAIEKVLKTGEKPITAIIGGAKVSSKITIIENILPVIDHLIIGGGMIFTFIKAMGGKIGTSLVEDDKMELALSLLEKAKENNVKVLMPVDVIAADAFSNQANTQIVSSSEIPENWMGLDVGPKTNQEVQKIIEMSKTILWNGPMGVFELPIFAQGTKSLGDAIAEATQKGAFSLVGGGDSVSAALQMGLRDKVSYISTGGGAMLESLEGKALPGVKAILS